MKTTTDCILVSFDSSGEKDKEILIVGRKTSGEVVNIVNAFQGEEAVELYKKLTTKGVK